MTPVEQQQQERFLRLFSAHEPAIRAFVRRLVPSRADADDVLQEAALVLWDKFDEFRDGLEFRAWAFGVARFKVLSWLRDRRRDRLVLSEEVVELIAIETEKDEPHLARQRTTLELCVEKLAPPQRDLLLAAYQPDSRIHEVAANSGRTVAGFYQWLHRIRQMLLECVRRELKQGFIQ
ncbi:MAG: sigma-70 family RNA polymerase sigma factor [Opitutaceae bacterium]|nr:sigma-70 family RNA polymerase sigma factor [Opitutaceae bacterium]